MFNIIASDKKHQFTINNDDLLSIEISLKKEDALEILLLSSNNDGDSMCTLMSETELKKHNIQLPLSRLGNFKLPGANKSTNNYLVNNLFLFLNKILRINDDEILLSQQDLTKIYNEVSNLVANTDVQSIRTQLYIMFRLIDKININIKNKYSMNEFFTISNFTNFVHNEKMLTNPISLACVITNAKENSKLLDNLGIKLEKEKQKTKA